LHPGSPSPQPRRVRGSRRLFLSLRLSTTGLDRGEEEPMRVEYLEIVTEAVDAVCAARAAEQGVAFTDPIPDLGNARVAELAGGGRVGVRAPMHESEKPVVRPYWLVDDIEAALATAVAAGAEVAHPPLEIPGQGTFAIYFLGGAQQGLWQK